MARLWPQVPGHDGALVCQLVGGVGVKREGRHACGGPSLSVLLCCGGVLLSHNPSVAVPSALPGLASRFGMLLGVSPVP